MSLKYALFKNHLTEDPNDYRAVTQGNESVAQSDIIDVMTDRGSTVTKAEALSSKEEEAAAIEEALKSGNSINTPLFNISMSIIGVFINEEDRFDPDRHQVKINISPGTRLKAIASQIPVERVAANKILPTLRNFTDFVSDTIDATLTPGGGGQLRGERLKVDRDDPAQGVFFVASDGSSTPVTQLMRNKPSELIFMIPNTLVPGQYTLEVRAIFPGNIQMRIGRSDYTLSVNPAS